jgi:hypothetical protein
MQPISTQNETAHITRYLWKENTCTYALFIGGNYHLYFVFSAYYSSGYMLILTMKELKSVVNSFSATLTPAAHTKKPLTESCCVM